MTQFEVRHWDEMGEGIELFWCIDIEEAEAIAVAEYGDFLIDVRAIA